ncbi:MAG TPA: ABC transporter substrate-binding protein [Bacteroidia bacterium]|nr:ABC transporter substrate-binding protein [Bacteroidia bacterium]
MKKIFYILITLGFLASCGGNSNENTDNRVAKGNVSYGGVFRMNEVEDFRSLYPLNVTEISGFHVASQIYEGLVKLSQSDLTVIPCIAQKWDVSPDAKTWTFYLRKNVYFQDDPCFPGGKGRPVTAADFKYCFDQLCTASPQNQLYQATFKGRVVGADEYYQSTVDKKPLAGGVSGVKVIDDYTLQITLKYPFAGFLNILTMPGCWLFPKEALDKYGIDMRVKCVGTGPFMVKEMKEGDAVVLTRNPKYWDVDEFGNQLPYLDAVKITFIKEKKSELLEFKQDHLEMVFQLPTEFIGDIMGDVQNAKKVNNFNLQVIPAMSIFYYGFQNQTVPFNNKYVRQAFNYAIDREKIVNYTLQGEGIPGFYGIVPPAFSNYDYKDIKGYSFDPDKAKQLLAKGGYPNGKGFPKITLQTNSGGGDRNIQIAEVIQKMLKENLNIDVEINVMPFAQHLEALETGKATFWRTGWIADYPDPSDFLQLLYGADVPKTLSEKSYLNSVRYVSPKFDSLYVKALRETDDTKRFELYKEADQVGIDDAAYMPIFYEEDYRLIQKYVKNFDINAMEYRDLEKVYFDKKEQAKEQQALGQ